MMEIDLRMKIFRVSSDDNLFDARDGLGAVPNNAEVSYFGFVKEMTPSQFLSLVPFGVSSDSTEEFAIEHMRSGGKLGNPFLVVEWDDLNKRWLVVDHEGRSRCRAIKKLYGDIMIPVHIFPNGGYRSRHLTAEMRGAEFLSQDLSNAYRRSL